MKTIRSGELKYLLAQIAVVVGLGALVLWASLQTNEQVCLEIKKEPKIGDIWICGACFEDEWCPKREVRYLMQIYEIRFPEVVFAQFILETGWGTSRLFLENLNPFGMKYPRQRVTASIGACRIGFATFSSLNSAIIDKRIWQTLFFHGSSMDEYLDFIGRVYAEDEDYIDKIRAIMRQNLWEFNNQ